MTLPHCLVLLLQESFQNRSSVLPLFRDAAPPALNDENGIWCRKQSFPTRGKRQGRGRVTCARMERNKVSHAITQLAGDASRLPCTKANLKQCAGIFQLPNRAHSFRDQDPQTLAPMTCRLQRSAHPTGIDYKCQSVVTCGRSPRMRTKGTRKQEDKTWPAAIRGIMGFLFPAAYSERPLRPEL